MSTEAQNDAEHVAPSGGLDGHPFVPTPGIPGTCWCGFDRASSVHWEQPDAEPGAPVGVPPEVRTLLVNAKAWSGNDTQAGNVLLALAVIELRAIREAVAPLGAFAEGLASFQPSGPMARLLGMGGPPGG